MNEIAIAKHRINIALLLYGVAEHLSNEHTSLDNLDIDIL